MSYLILNGKDSRQIKGLIIQELPPITKPKKRVKIDEIDGLDGDIITENGFLAYDKEVSIGLSSDYDIDEVIEYFNSEGTVIFSNEEDKYYKYKIYEQIDFEKLLRFRIAKVKFHVQPFKHLISETEFDAEIYNKEVTGKEIILKDANTVCQKITLDITNVENKNLLIDKNIILKNKNLFFNTGDKKMQFMTRRENGLEFGRDEENIVITGTSTAKTEFNISLEYSKSFTVKGSTGLSKIVTAYGYDFEFLNPNTYNLSVEGTTTGINKLGFQNILNEYDEESDETITTITEIFMLENGESSKSKKFTSEDISKMNYFSIIVEEGETVNAKFKVQFEEGSSKTSYYVPQTEILPIVEDSENIMYCENAQMFENYNLIYNRLFKLKSMTAQEKEVIVLINEGNLKVKYTQKIDSYVYNLGNIYSKPKIKIEGKGTIILYLNDYPSANINLGDEEYIIVDIDKMDAYKENENDLKNRLITCNYENLKFNVGRNKLSFDGTVYSINISNKSRFV